MNNCDHEWSEPPEHIYCYRCDWSFEEALGELYKLRHKVEEMQAAIAEFMDRAIENQLCLSSIDFDELTKFLQEEE